MKPLGYKSYGSIPICQIGEWGREIITVRRGRRASLRRARDRHDVVIVQEKLDGLKRRHGEAKTAEIIPLTRAGYRTTTGPWSSTTCSPGGLWSSGRCLMHSRVRGRRFVVVACTGPRHTLRPEQIRTQQPFAAFDIMRGYETRSVLQRYPSTKPIRD